MKFQDFVLNYIDLWGNPFGGAHLFNWINLNSKSEVDDFSPGHLDLKSCYKHWFLSLFYKNHSGGRLENELEGGNTKYYKGDSLRNCCTNPEDVVLIYTGAIGDEWMWERE